MSKKLTAQYEPQSKKFKKRDYVKYLEEGVLGDTRKAPKGKIVGSKKRHKETTDIHLSQKDKPKNRGKGPKKSTPDYDASQRGASSMDKASVKQTGKSYTGKDPIVGKKVRAKSVGKKMASARDRKLKWEKVREYKEGGEVYKKTGKGGKLETKVVKGIAKGVQKFEKVMGIDPSNTDKQDLGVMGGAMAGGAAGSAFGPLGTLVGIVGGSRTGKKLMTKKKKKEMGGEVKYANGGKVKPTISNEGKKTFIQRDAPGRLGPAYQQQQRPDVGKQGYSDAEQVERWKAIKEFDSAPGGENVLKSRQRQAHKDVMKSKFDKAGETTGKMKEMKFRGKPKMKEGGPVAKHDKGQTSKKKSFLERRIDTLRTLTMLEAEQKHKTGKEMAEAWNKTKEKIASLSKKEKPKVKVTKFKDGGAVRVHEGSVHKAAGDPVTTYQASNSNYKEGK